MDTGCGVARLVTQLDQQCSAVCLLLFNPHLPNGNEHVTREPAIAKQMSMSPRAMQDDDLDHLHTTESTWILSCYSGNQLRHLMVSNTRRLFGKLVQFLRYITSHGYPILVLSSTSGDDHVYQSNVDSCSRTGIQSRKISWCS